MRIIFSAIMAAGASGLLLLAACQSEPGQEEGIQNETWARRASGMYKAQLPCSDCEAIDMSLWVKPDHTYLARISYRGSEREGIVNEGVFSFTADSVLVLEKAEEGLQHFIPYKNDLLAVQASGMGMIDEDGEKIILSKSTVNSTRSSDASSASGSGSSSPMRRFAAEGWDFYALGNEPSWNLHLDFDRKFFFSELGKPDFTTPAVEGAMAMDADPARTRYRSEVESGTLTFSIISSPCTDQMSGEGFSHTVELEVQRGTQTPKTLKGCGRYVPDYRLNGKWALLAIDGKGVDTKGLPKGIPMLEFDMDDLAVSGHNGCNSFSGSFHMLRGAIVMGPAAGTMMACPNMRVEDAFQQKLFDRVWEYEVNGGKLMVETPGGTVFDFSRN